MNEYYVCSKFDCNWYGLIDEMLEGYYYPDNSTWFFASVEEAQDKVDWLNQLTHA